MQPCVSLIYVAQQGQGRPKIRKHNSVEIIWTYIRIDGTMGGIIQVVTLFEQSASSSKFAKKEANDRVLAVSHQQHCSIASFFTQLLHLFGVRQGQFQLRSDQVNHPL